MDRRQTVGVDAGGTLIKIAVRDENGLFFHTYPVARMNACAYWLNHSLTRAEVCVTGGRAAMFINQLTHRMIHQIGEFDASSSGAQYLLENQPGRAPDSFILTNVGTGTSIHVVSGRKSRRLTGTGVGGGTIIGLCSLLTEITDFDRLMILAEQGKREHADLTVADVYRGQKAPIPGNLTASNFGSVPERGNSVSFPDRIASVIGLVAETAATISIMAAENEGIHTIVYIGSSFYKNPLLANIITSYSKFRGKTPVIPENGRYSGAIGALLALENE